jgi:hypothetical protein
MSTICWTILHHSAAPVARNAAQAARHHAGHIHHHVARAVRHSASTATSPHTWLEVVCRVVPAAIVSGGVLAPHPANPPRLPESPPSIVQTAPPATPLVLPPGLPSFVSSYPPAVAPKTGATPASPVTPVPEPASAGVLLFGAVVLLLIRVFSRRAWF